MELHPERSSREEEQEELLGNEHVPDGAEPESELGESVICTGGGVSVDVALQRIGFGRFQYGLCAALGWALSADAIETLAVSFLLPFALCELQATSLDKGVLSAVGFLGMLVGSVMWGVVADGIGRQRALLWCQSMNALFSIASSFTQNFAYLVAMRLLSGIGVGGTLPLLSVYFAEFLPLQQRGRWMGLFTCFWMIGQFLVSGLAWAVLPHTDWDFSAGGFRFNSWRIFLLLASVPCLTSALSFISFPESPHYLVQKGRKGEAMKVLQQIFASNKPSGSNVTVSAFPEFTLASTPPTTTAAVPLARVSNVLKGAASRAAAIFTNRRHRTTFLMSGTVFFCIGFSSYGLTMWFPELFKRMQLSNGTSVCSVVVNRSAPSDRCNAGSLVLDASTVFSDSFLQAVATLPGNVGFLCIIGVVGRKFILGGSLIVSGAMVFFIWLVQSHAAGVTLAMAFTAVNTLSWNSLTLMAVELFPTDVRSTAQGMQTSMIRLASILVNVMIGALIDTHCSVAMLLMGSVLVIGSCVSLFLPNTSAHELR